MKPFQSGPIRLDGVGIDPMVVAKWADRIYDKLKPLAPDLPRKEFKELISEKPRLSLPDIADNIKDTAETFQSDGLTIPEYLAAALEFQDSQVFYTQSGAARYCMDAFMGKYGKYLTRADAVRMALCGCLQLFYLSPDRMAEKIESIIKKLGCSHADYFNAALDGRIVLAGPCEKGAIEIDVQEKTIQTPALSAPPVVEVVPHIAELEITQTSERAPPPVFVPLPSMPMPTLSLPRLSLPLYSLPLSLPLYYRPLSLSLLPPVELPEKTGHETADASAEDLFEKGRVAKFINKVVELLAPDLTFNQFRAAVRSNRFLLLVTPETLPENINGTVAKFTVFGLTRSIYVQAALDNPRLFVTPPEAVTYKEIREIINAPQQRAADRRANMKRRDNKIETEPAKPCRKPDSVFDNWAPATVNRNIDTVGLYFKRAGLTRPYCEQMAQKCPLLFMEPKVVIRRINIIVGMHARQEFYIAAAQNIWDALCKMPVVLELPEEHLKYLSRAANILKSKCGQMYSFRTLFKKSQEEMDAILAANSIRADAVLKIQKKAR